MSGQSGNTIVHMVGSLPLSDAEEAFRTIGGALGRHVERIPDGETGRRRRWISFIADQLKEHPDLEVDREIPPYQFKQWDGKVVFEFEQLKFRDGVDPSAVAFNTGYADDAILAFESFDRLQGQGVIPEGVKYQICMATPLAITYMFIAPGARTRFLEVYEDHLADEFRRIAATLPHDRISYQWDVCQEVLMWEGYFDQPPGYKEQILSCLGRIGDMAPETIDVGYHLCYGSPQDEHMVQPKDMALLVEMANGIVAAVSRPIRYIHMPAPKDRSDDAYFRPLTDLDLPQGTDLYLGLVHAQDSEGNAQRLAVAQSYASVAGVAAECGLGRSDPDLFPNVLEEHRRLAEA